MTRKTKVFASVAVATAMLVATGGALYFSVTPRWRTASKDEIDKVIDPALLRHAPPDPAAIERYKKFQTLLKALTYPPSTGFTARSPLGSPPASSLSAISPPRLFAGTNSGADFAKANLKSLAEMERLLREGPMQHPANSIFEPFYPPSTRTLAKGIAAMIEDTSTTPLRRLDALNFGVLYETRELESSEDLMDFLTARSIQSILTISTQKSLRAHPLALRDAKTFLASLPSFEKEADLSRIVVGDFQGSIYQCLCQPDKFLEEMSRSPDEDNQGTPAGSLDTLSAAKEFSDAAMEQLRALSSPGNAMPTPNSDRIKAIQASLPEDDSAGKTGLRRWWAKTAYRYKMARIPNSFAMQFAPFLDFRDIRDVQKELLASEQLLRLQLACSIFWTGNGHLPSALEDLVDAHVIAAVPLDPCDGKPMRYDQARCIVWSVGRNGVDENGKEATTGRPPDLVVHLAPAMK